MTRRFFNWAPLPTHEQTECLRKLNRELGAAEDVSNVKLVKLTRGQYEATGGTFHAITGEPRAATIWGYPLEVIE